MDAHDDREKYARAKAHVRTLKALHIHFSVFMVAMTVLFAIDHSSGSSWWVHWPFIYWGMGLLGHAFLVFAPGAGSTPNWERRQIMEALAKL